MRKKKEAGYWVGCVPFGYRLEGEKDGKQLVLGDPSNIAIVQRIFEERMQGDGVTEISNRLNSEGIPSPRSKTWKPPCVQSILGRRAYLGDSVFGGAISRGRYEKIASEVTTIRDTHPAIIDRETFAAVEQMPKSTRCASRNGSEGSQLSGLLRCGRCGAKMYSKSNGNGSAYYVCASFTHGDGCGHCAIKRDPIMRAVVTKIQKHVLLGSQDALEAEIQRQLDRRDPSQDTKALAKRLAKLGQPD